jgi:hypothetical protein
MRKVSFVFFSLLALAVIVTFGMIGRVAFATAQGAFRTLEWLSR